MTPAYGPGFEPVSSRFNDERDPPGFRSSRRRFYGILFACHGSANAVSARGALCLSRFGYNLTMSSFLTVTVETCPFSLLDFTISKSILSLFLGFLFFK